MATRSVLKHRPRPESKTEPETEGTSALVPDEVVRACVDVETALDHISSLVEVIELVLSIDDYDRRDQAEIALALLLNQAVHGARETLDELRTKALAAREGGAR
jgi:hypothetical protein